MLGLRRTRSSDGGRAIRTKPSSSVRKMTAPFRRSKTSDSAGNRRRQSEMNIIGTEFMVSTDYTLKMLNDAQENKTVTKLELEDLVLKDGIKESTKIHEAVKELLANDGGREWKYIKFLDQIEVRGEECTEYDNSEYYVSMLRQYGRAKELLWSQIEKYCTRRNNNKPVMFQVKLVFHQGTGLTTAKQLLAALRELAVVQIDFGGALFNTSQVDIPPQLALQFNSKTQCLDEMVMLTLTWNRTKAYPTWTDATLRECINKLGDRAAGIQIGRGDSRSSTRSSRNEGDAAGNGQASPRRRGKATRTDSTKSDSSRSLHRQNSKSSNNRHTSPNPSSSATRRGDRRISGRSRSSDSSGGGNRRPVHQSNKHSPAPSPKDSVPTPTPSPPPSPSSPASPFQDMKVSALKILCNARGINTDTMLEKQEMIDALSC